jgi:hypothetical protein
LAIVVERLRAEVADAQQSSGEAANERSAQEFSHPECRIVGFV